MEPLRLVPELPPDIGQMLRRRLPVACDHRCFTLVFEASAFAHFPQLVDEVARTQAHLTMGTGQIPSVGWAQDGQEAVVVLSVVASLEQQDWLARHYPRGQFEAQIACPDGGLDDRKVLASQLHFGWAAKTMRKAEARDEANERRSDRRQRAAVVLAVLLTGLGATKNGLSGPASAWGAAWEGPAGRRCEVAQGGAGAQGQVIS